MNAVHALCALVLTILVTGATQASPLTSLLEKRGPVLLKQARTGVTEPRSVYVQFVDILAAELAKDGHRETAARIRSAVTDPSLGEFPRTEMAWITHTFAREFYRDSVIAHASALIRFRTFEVPRLPNRDNPEFHRQRDYLRTLAERLGLNFADVGGYVYEIWIGEGSLSFGLACHSDVVPDGGGEWKHDPWLGTVADGKLWGRGAVDDKTPIIVVMYGMKALLDSGLPLTRKIILLVGTDEERANEDIAWYLKKRPAPDSTIVIDASYPVNCAEKGWGGVWMHIRRTREVPAESGMLIVDLAAGYSPSAVPDRASATIVPVGMSIANAKQYASAKYELFKKRRKQANFSIATAGDTLFITAHGKSAHSSTPELGYNALMDLLVYLDRDLKVMQNDMGVMANFATSMVGFELKGKSLGIAHRDPFMGDLTVAATQFHVTDTTVMFMFNLRIPKGISEEKIESELTKRFGAYMKKHDMEMFDQRWMGKPAYSDPRGAFVGKLLRIYDGITKQQGKARSTPGGTYASKLPNAVVFGPALQGERYRGHETNEHIAISTILRNIEILTNVMVEFGM